jgi:hypothetical protein
MAANSSVLDFLGLLKLAIINVKYQDQKEKLLKTQINCYLTLVQMNVLAGNKNFSIFDSFLPECCEEILKSKENISSQLNLHVRPKNLEIFNTILIEAPTNLLGFIAKRMALTDFLLHWYEALNFSNTKNGFLINAIASLALIKNLPVEVSSMSFEKLTCIALPEVYKYQDRVSGFEAKERQGNKLREKEYSHRAEALVQSSPYLSWNLESIFKETLKVLICITQAFQEACGQKNVAVRLLRTR